MSAAYETLIEAGVDAVRIQPLGRRVRLSRTSFYWFFADRNALLSALLDLWRDKNTGNLIKQAGAYADSITEAMFNVFDCWLDTSIFDAQFEFAVRSWALQSTEVADEIVRADVARLTALSDMFLRFGFDDLAADVRSRTMYLTQIGYISMNLREDTETRMARIPDYVKIFTGTDAKPKELARFRARHQLAQGDRSSGNKAA